MLSTEFNEETIKHHPCGVHEERRCQYYVPHKNRVCRLMAAFGRQFCGEHLIFEHEAPETVVQKPKTAFVYANPRRSKQLGVRIWCPLDPRHTVDEHELERHMKCCNARSKRTAGYVVKDLHKEASEVESATNCPAIFHLKDVPENLVHQDLHFLDSHQIPLTPYSPIQSESEFFLNSGEETQKKLGKHPIQCVSLIKHLEIAGLLQTKSILIEVGAGKGVLARYIHEALERKGPEAIVLVDRSNVRKKADSFIRSSNQVDLERCLVDIKDLDLRRLDILKRHPNKPIVIVGKHVCGTGTDLTLKCAAHAVEHGLPIQAILIALCCHHRCEWTQYCNQSWMKKHDIDNMRFRILSAMSTWTVSGSGKSLDLVEDLHQANVPSQARDARNIPSDSIDRSKLSIKERERLGNICKRIIDEGRLAYLLGCGFSAELIFYVKSETTPENTALFARRNNWK